MNHRDPSDGRETIWGINRHDRRWFQAMTLVGGNIGSVSLTILILTYSSGRETPDAVALDILLGIGASFVAAGFISWNLVQIKELTMAIADWIREATEKRRQRLLAEGRAEGRAEGYDMGYDDAEQGRPRRRPTDKPEGGRPKADQTP